MARPYSNDLRERVAAATSAGRSCREVASLFDVSVASVVKWSQRRRATGSAAAKPMGGHRKRLLEPHRALVIERLKAVPDLTLKALVAELAERGIATCPVSVWRLVRSEGMSFKKKLVRRGAAAPGDRKAARAVEEISGAARSPATCLHR
jgi:transposase